MAAQNPQIKDNLVAGQWNLVATDIKTGILHILKQDVIYYQTYRLTGQSAPNNSPSPGDADFEGALVYSDKQKFHNVTTIIGGASVTATSGIDVYIYVQDPYEPYGDIGRIRIDVGE
jgi:hypothetical protein